MDDPIVAWRKLDWNRLVSYFWGGPVTWHDISARNICTSIPRQKKDYQSIDFFSFFKSKQFKYCTPRAQTPLSRDQIRHLLKTCGWNRKRSVWKQMCCIVTLDPLVNQRFSKQDAPVKISGISHMVDRKCVGITKWYLQMTTWGSQSVGVSVNLKSVPACSGVVSADREPWLQGAKRPPGENRLSTSRQKRKRKAVKITQHSMVKRRRSYGSI